MTGGTVLLVVVMLVLFGAIPSWPHRRGWGDGPDGARGVVVGGAVRSLTTRQWGFIGAPDVFSIEGC